MKESEKGSLGLFVALIVTFIFVSLPSAFPTSGQPNGKSVFAILALASLTVLLAVAVGIALVIRHLKTRKLARIGESETGELGATEGQGVEPTVKRRKELLKMALTGLLAIASVGIFWLGAQINQLYPTYLLWWTGIITGFISVWIFISSGFEIIVISWRLRK